MDTVRQNRMLIILPVGEAASALSGNGILMPANTQHEHEGEDPDARHMLEVAAGSEKALGTLVHRYQEIADVLGIPLGTVKSRINLAMTSMRSWLNEN